MAWTNRAISPRIYNVINGFTVFGCLGSLDGPLVTIALLTHIRLILAIHAKKLVPRFVVTQTAREGKSPQEKTTQVVNHSPH